MTPRFLNLRTGGNLRSARPGLIREGIKLVFIIGLCLFFYGVTP